MNLMKLANVKEHWMLYAAIAGGVLIAYRLYSAGKSAGASVSPLSPAQQALQSQDAKLLNQLAQPDYNPINYVGAPPTPGASSSGLLALGAAIAGLYLIHSGGVGR